MNTQTHSVSRLQPLRCLLLALALPAGAAMAGSIPATLEIYEIQGNGQSSSYAGASVHVPDSVVTAVLPDGFFLQTPDARADADSSLTSNGIRVVTGSAPTYSGGAAVGVGHLLEATGTVNESAGQTVLVLGSPPVRVGTGTVSLPAATELSVAAGKPRSSADNLYCHNNVSNFECFEGMLVTMPTGVVASGNASASGDAYAEVFVSPLGSRSLREKGVRFGDNVQPGNELAGIWDGNPEVLRMDADRFGAVANGTAIAGGATFTATGVITVDDGDYAFWPKTLAINAASNTLPVAVGAAQWADSFRVATFDVTALTASNVAAKAPRLAAYIANVLGRPDVIALQHVENATVLATLATQASGSGAIYAGHLIEGSDPSGLDLAFLVRTDRITGVSVSQQAAAETWTDPVAGPGTLVHPMPPLLLEGSFAYGVASTQEFRVLNVKVASRDGVDDGTNGARERRFQQAASLASIVDTMQKSDSRPLVVAGKLNDFVPTDGYVDVVGMLKGTYYNPENLLDVSPFNEVFPLLGNVVELAPEDERVTAMLFESFGAVQGSSDRSIAAATAFDHLLLTQPAQQIAMDYGIGRGNADAAVQVQTSGTGAAGSSLFDAVTVDFYPDCTASGDTNTDGDEWCNLFDNCPTIVNNDQLDTDGDGDGDACDPDIDGDGILNDDDNCPLLANVTQSDIDGDSIGDVCDTDMDGDGLDNEVDNCPTVSNADQANWNQGAANDRGGDACDPNADMSLTLGASPNPVGPGDTLTLTANVGHLQGPQDVQALTLTIATPGPLELTSVTQGAWDCGDIPVGSNGAVLVCQMPLLANGASAPLTLQGTTAVWLSDGTALTTSANVTPLDLDESNNADELQVLVEVDETDLELDASGPVGPVSVGDDVTYAVTITNLGSAASANPVMSVQRPAGTEFFGTVVKPAGWTCDAPSPSLEVLECTAASVPIGGSAQFQFTLLIGTGANGTMMQVSPTVSADTTDPNLLNNTDTVTVEVGAIDETIFTNGFE